MRTTPLCLALVVLCFSSATAQDASTVVSTSVDAHVIKVVDRTVVRTVLRDSHVQEAYRQDFGELMLEGDISVAEGGLLLVDVHDADLVVETHDEETAYVEVFMRARDWRRAEAYFEDLRFAIEDYRDGLRITTEKPRRFNFGGNRSGGANITVVVRIPERFDLELGTSDGDIALESIIGDVLIKTSDGDIRTASVTGDDIVIQTSDGDIDSRLLSARDLSIKTSDGDITLDEAKAKDLEIITSDGDITADHLEGDTEARTSDGDISLGTVVGPRIALRTSDGDIDTESLEAESIEAGTSDGHLSLGTVSGELRATTSSGDISVTLLDPAETFLKSSDGDITIEFPEDFSSDVYAKAERVRLNFEFNGEVRKNEADGRIGNGGPLLEARSSDGTITLRKR